MHIRCAVHKSALPAICTHSPVSIHNINITSSLYTLNMASPRITVATPHPQRTPPPGHPHPQSLLSWAPVRGAWPHRTTLLPPSPPPSPTPSSSCLPPPTHPPPPPELAELGPSERATEEATLQELLLPHGLAIKEIRVRRWGHLDVAQLAHIFTHCGPTIHIFYVWWLLRPGATCMTNILAHYGSSAFQFPRGLLGAFLAV
jgi:hypothetical protein